MLKRNSWKIILSLVILGWAIDALLPLKDVFFPTYVRDHATARRDDFDKLVKEAEARWDSKAAPSVYVALKQIAQERKIDLSQFFPRVRLEDSLKNITKRNDILMKYLLDQSKGRLQLGLDLRGGVGFTLEADLGEKNAGADK